MSIFRIDETGFSRSEGCLRRFFVLCGGCGKVGDGIVEFGFFFRSSFVFFLFFRCFIFVVGCG